jgi:hypothetical protein
MARPAHEAPFLDDDFGIPLRPRRARRHRGIRSRHLALDFFARNGLDLSRFPEMMRSGNGYRRGVPEIPRQYRRLMDGDRLPIGWHDWRVITVFGHAPEHAALWCASRNILISGDQVLPRITTNVGVWGNQPEANPLAQFLTSLGKLAELPATPSCCPRTIASSAVCTRASRSSTSTTRTASRGSSRAAPSRSRRTRPCPSSSAARSTTTS